MKHIEVNAKTGSKKTLSNRIEKERHPLLVGRLGKKQTSQLDFLPGRKKESSDDSARRKGTSQSQGKTEEILYDRSNHDAPI